MLSVVGDELVNLIQDSGVFGDASVGLPDRDWLARIGSRRWRGQEDIVRFVEPHVVVKSPSQADNGMRFEGGAVTHFEFQRYRGFLAQQSPGNIEFATIH